MARILMALVGLIGFAFVGAVVALVTGETAVGVLLSVVAVGASIAIPIVMAIVLGRRARAAVTAFGAAARGSAGFSGLLDATAATTTTTSDRPASSWLPGQSASSFTTTTTTSGDLDQATAEAMVRSLTGLGIDELVRRATSGEPISGADEPSVVDVASMPRSTYSSACRARHRTEQWSSTTSHPPTCLDAARRSGSGWIPNVRARSS